MAISDPIKDRIREYATAQNTDKFDVAYMTLESAEELGHAVFQTRDSVTGEPVQIALWD